MDKNKAIQLLERLQDPEPYEPMLTKDAYDAIQMAIDALSADGDTISREAAVEALDDAEDAFGYLTRDWREVLNELPPVQPEQLEPDQNGDLWITVPDIDKVTRIFVQEGKSKFCRIFCEEQEQPERIKGHWIEMALSNHTYKCSECGRLLVNITDGKNNVAKNYPYCHCGADMRGKQDERDS